ncbi:hypothetical protein CP533_0029, partial [Ophiocordyceps camponoti-saundersi (nom. inval.)]
MIYTIDKPIWKRSFYISADGFKTPRLVRLRSSSAKNTPLLALHAGPDSHSPVLATTHLPFLSHRFYFLVGNGRWECMDTMFGPGLRHRWSMDLRCRRSRASFVWKRTRSLAVDGMTVSAWSQGNWKLVDDDDGGHVLAVFTNQYGCGRCGRLQIKVDYGSDFDNMVLMTLLALYWSGGQWKTFNDISLTHLATASKSSSSTTSPSMPPEKMDLEIRQKMADPIVEPLHVEGQFAAILTDAATSYKEKSGRPLEKFMTPPMASVDDLKRELSLQNDGFLAFRAKRQAIFSAVSVALRPIELVGDIVAGAASQAFAPSQTIYSASLYLINAGHNVSSTYDSIIELFEQLSDFTTRLEVYLRYTMSPSLRSKIVSILVALFDVIVLATKEIRRGRFRAYFKRIIGSASPVQPALDRLKALTQGEERQVLADTFGNVSDLGTKAGRIESIVSQVNQGVQILQVEHRELASRRNDDKLRAILNPSPFADDIYCALKKSIVPNTGAWILSDESLNAWLRAEVPYLWIFGNAGTGKSFVVTSVISWTRENADKFPCIGYFYFRADNPETRSVLQALRDVAHQLSEKDVVYRKELASRLDSRDEIKTVASAFRKLFTSPVGRQRIKYIFLDGIDEADPDEIQELLGCLAPEEDELPPPPHFQFALIGRPYLSDNVDTMLNSNGQSLATVQVTSDRNASDVRAFINSSVFHSRVLSRTSVDFKTKVIAALEQQADGFFIVAKFMLDDVNRKRHQSSILESLQTYPKEINSVLQRTLTDLCNTITDEEARDLREILCWVTCAEEPLTLGQLEAALVLRFGDPPMFLEESLRRQYSCFFDLEREDGLTTDDLVKDAGRLFQREPRRDLGGPSRFFSQHPAGRSFSAGEASMPKRNLSPAAGKNRNSIGGISNSVDGASPRLSGSSFDVASDTEFRSSKSTTRVVFFHSSVRDFFRASRPPAKSSSASASLGLDVGEARLRIVKTCLRIFTDKDWFLALDLGPGKEALRQYAAWYWQEHVASIDPATVARQEKRQLAGQLYRMLTEESTVHDWTIMYEKNDEGLEVLNDANIRGLQRWFRDADIVDGLNAGAAAAFAEAASARAAGVCEKIGRYYARAWLSNDFEGYVPPLFCFKIVQSVAFLDAGYGWSQGNTHAVKERMARATSWAAQVETAHWHRRVGSTYLMMGFADDALRHYDAALTMDRNSVETSSRIAYCLYKDGRFHDALEKSVECAAMEERDIRDGRLSRTELRNSRWRLYRDYLVIAKCAHQTGNVEYTHAFFAKAMTAAGDAGLSPSESLEAEADYLEALAADNLHGQMVALAKDMAAQTSRNDHGKGRFVDLLLEHDSSDLVLDWMPKAACKAGQLAFFLDQAGRALEVADSMSDSTRALYLRLALGTGYTYNGDADKAMAVFEHISLLEARPRGTIATRRAHAVSFQKLAGLYKQKALRAGGPRTAAGEAWVRKLEAVQSKQLEHRNADMPTVMLGSDINVASIYLASFYRLQGREDEALALLSGLISDSLAILSDSEPENDVFALDNLLRIFIAADDVPNAQALARSMRRVNPEASISTPGDSPVERRNATGAPKLPGIRQHDRSCFQCLEMVAPSAEFVMCLLCMESYCRRCMDRVILRGEGDGPDDEKDEKHETRGRIMCRSDHDWFTVEPLNRVLHTGEILVDEGVQGFAEWKDGVRRDWGIV